MIGPDGQSRGLGAAKEVEMFAIKGWAGRDLLTSTGDIVGRWKEYFKELFIVTLSTEQVEAGDYEENSAITQAEVTKVVIKYLSGRASGTDDVCPEYLKSLDLVGMSWLKCLCNIAWQSGTVPLEWQPGMVDLQHVLRRFAAKCEAVGIKISTSKSEAMVLDQKRVVCPLQVGGEVLPQVEEFRSEGRMEHEIERLIGAASSVMQSVYRAIMVKRACGKVLDLPVSLLIYGWLRSSVTQGELRGAVLCMSHLEEALRQTQDMLKRPGSPGSALARDLLTSTGDIVGRWKEYFKELFIVTLSTEQVEAGDYEENSAITQAEVTKVVIKYLSGSDHPVMEG
ncbi:hypothetical protein D4764_12G0009360 [Takifugu flavidus]|uniref:Uncharacterized protein n=1 Tax=Takifugu flavidus TaxID=433684 RepID=A0A5C6PEF7_9TELE|nr:hypothetical protein D4764_12G0009360 [Takifugu flavidus]